LGRIHFYPTARKNFQEFSKKQVNKTICLIGNSIEGTMESATPLNTRLMENEGTLQPRRGSLVIDDRMIYDELIAPLEAMMMRSIWRVVRNADLAEDCLQDALAVIWKKRFRIRLHPNPPALILKICLNASYDSLRKRERMRRHTDLSQLDNAPAPPGHGADLDLEEKEIEEQVQQAIRRLPRKRALAVMMRLIQEESFEAIAQALDCSEVTVRIHISRGRAQLRKWLSPLWESSRKEASNE
jgi:RNA polymerase sigma-70 factor, ECF subfamily